MVPRIALPWIQRLRAVRTLGLLPAIVYKFQRCRAKLTRNRRPFRLTSALARHPLWCRPASSDLEVFNQIFVGREYRCLDSVQEAGLIVDCGANVGYSSAYFLTKFPRCELIAIEPDAENFALLQRNLAPYGSRSRLIQSAVWSHPCGLVVTAGDTDGREWSRSVRETREGEAAHMTAVDLGGVLRQSGHDRISILKMDIEGAEAVVFPSADGWLPRVDYLIIELHGESCEGIFHQAIAGMPFAVSRCDELTVCKRSYPVTQLLESDAPEGRLA